MNDKTIWLKLSIVDGVLRVTDQHGNPVRGLIDLDISIGVDKQIQLNIKTNVYEVDENGNTTFPIGFNEFEIKSYETK